MGIEASIFIAKYADYLKKQGKIIAPSFCEYAKTGSHKELGPYDPDWWYHRIASITRKLYITKGLGVGRLSHMYAGARSKGNRPRHHAHSSRKIIRKSLQQLEEIGVIEKSDNGGRRITTSGRRDIKMLISTNH